MGLEQPLWLCSSLLSLPTLTKPLVRRLPSKMLILILHLVETANNLRSPCSQLRLLEPSTWPDASPLRLSLPRRPLTLSPLTQISSARSTIYSSHNRQLDS